MQNTFKMFSNASKLQKMNVTISTLNYEVTVASENDFYTVFNLTDRSLDSLVKTGCFINNYSDSVDYTSQA